MSEPAILKGGPHDGKEVTGTKANTIETVYVKPVPIIFHPPRPSWWHPIRRMRWRPPPPPEPLEFIQLRYEADGTTDDGRWVFRLTSEWRPYCGPCADVSNGDVYPALVNAMYGAHPAIRQDRQTRWVMNLDWYKRIREMAVTHDPDDEDDKPEKWKPDPGDLLMGLNISVTADGGLPHLENPRFPHDWQ